MLHEAHRLVADVVCFRGPHVNHLTPRTLDIDAVQQGMPAHGVAPKAVVEGPPHRQCPILLRQTSFRALQEPISILSQGGEGVPGSHTARFGEIEQCGGALTRQGRALYDRCLARARDAVIPAADGLNADAYVTDLKAAFRAFPDSQEELRRQGLAYFEYYRADPEAPLPPGDLESLIAKGAVGFAPLVYEDFLPDSATGIFQSNLGDRAVSANLAAASRAEFVPALGAEPHDPFALYDALEAASLTGLGIDPGAA